MSFARLTDSQYEVKKQIERLVSNFKKTSKSRYSHGYLSTRLEQLDGYWTEFKSQHQQIKQHVTTENKSDRYFTEEVYDDTEELFMDFKGTLKDFLKSTEEQTSQPQTSNTSGHKVKLPPISLPTFSGCYREWMHFKDLFTSLIDDNQELSDIEKHHYLRTSLTGEADQLLRHFDITAANYRKAFDTLKQRYSNKRIIVNNLLNRFLNQKKITVESSSSLKELLDASRECLNSLQNLEINTKDWDPIVVHVMVSKLDPETHKCWEQSLGASTTLPTLEELTNYIEGRFRALEMVQNTTKKDTTYKRDNTNTRQVKTFTTETETQCTYCTKQHYICHCTEFSQLDIEQRKDFVKNNGLCFNCLIKGHSIKFCRQTTVCKKCGRRHHTLLHENARTNFNEPESTQVAVNTTTELEPEGEDSQIVSMKATTSNLVVLATAVIGVKDKRGIMHKLRALVDQGSQATFVTESVAQTLGLKKHNLPATITGIGNAPVFTKHAVDLEIHSPIDNKYVTKVNAHVIKGLTQSLPTGEFNTDDWPQLKKLELSDSTFNKTGPIDVLLGADVYAVILLDGLHKHKNLMAQNSMLGWLISGSALQKISNSHSLNVVVNKTLVQIDQTLRKFWETEEYSCHEAPITLEDAKCEDHYQRTHTRNSDGRYVVRLPFKDGYEHKLGNSKDIAVNRLLHMERKFVKKPEFKKDYTEFIEQYEKLEHMEEVTDPSKIPNHKIYHLPHHAVIRESSVSTKLRVVFDGTAQPSDGSSLNEGLMVGPSLLQNITNLIVRWRQHKICLIGDIKQMYRQILVSKEDVDYQRIVWRNTLDEPIVEKRLLTVTYGTACAPYLAIRTLHQLAEDEKANFPELVSVVKSDFYMDDLLTGASDESEAIKLQKRVTSLMLRGQFQMHKWSSNSSVVLKEIADHDKLQDKSLNIIMDDSIKALGIRWNAHKDCFELKIDVERQETTFTKTTVLSDIARAFDPLGYMGPIIVIAKIILQKLWLSGVNWNDELPHDLLEEWSCFRDQLLHMKPIPLNRWLYTTFSNDERVEIHGFSDASTAAYSAVVYLRVITKNHVHVSIVIAKTKVAPVKQVSLPRLELCGAVLLAKLLKDATQSLNVDISQTFAWTDSMIVLSWLRRHPIVWKTYVANRTTEILNVLSSDRWHHVKSSDNPADAATRGQSPKTLQDNEMWWHGPSFLRESENISYPQSNIPDTSIELKTSEIKTSMMTQQDEIFSYSYLNRFSKLSKLISVTAWIMRFYRRCKHKVGSNRNHINDVSSNHLTVNELKCSLDICIILSQDLHFHNERQLLGTGSKLPKSSKLQSLSPFLDVNGILRVSGRLQNSLVSYDEKSPIILSSNCHLTRIIVIDAHLKALHSGPQLTLNLLRRRYWIIGARSLVKKMVHQCLKCFRQNPPSIEQLMGQLPSERVTPDKPFSCSGVDYAGPVTLKLYAGRCKRTCKAYICLFVCMVTKAIHLELVSDLTTSAFLAAFRRFTSRRGHCSNIWSDCATNFVGASKELDIMFKNSQSQFAQDIIPILANDNTTWHFISPASPHFGGLWEAGVKSIKGHIKRVIGQTLLTFEEYTTLLAQVEACVNSRPLTYLSNSKDDPLPLTPGHFLIGQSHFIIPEESYENIRLSHLDRWQMIQRMLQDVWSRWHQEYLLTLQQRYKWQIEKKEPDVGSVVLVKDERLPPGKWLLARITEKHPGKDGLTRVVTVKYKDGFFKRPITKLCPLPSDS